MFTSKEPTRFGISCVGSRAMASKLDPTYLASLKDIVVENGTFWEAARNAGYGLDTKGHDDMVKQCALDKTYYDSFLELHIEQGPLLEREGINLGLDCHRSARGAQVFLHGRRGPRGGAAHARSQRRSAGGVGARAGRGGVRVRHGGD